MGTRYFALSGAVLLTLFQTVNATIHPVKKGDTLYSLSRTYGVTIDEIRQANPGMDGSSLIIGRSITIPEQVGVKPAAPRPVVVVPGKSGEEIRPVQPEFFVVKRGDTLFGIAHQTGVSVQELLQLNAMRDNRLRVGQNLRIRKSCKELQAVVPGGEREDFSATKYLFVSKARSKIDAPPLGPRSWRYVVVHHSGTGSGSARIFEYYHRQVRGMENGMAYHFVIGNGSDSGDGEIEVGNRWFKQLQGGHLKSDEQDEVAIGICLVGDFNKAPPTRNQMAALIELVSYLEQRINRTEHISPKFAVHRDINIRPTECPGKYFPAAAMYKLFGNWTGE